MKRASDNVPPPSNNFPLKAVSNVIAFVVSVAGLTISLNPSIKRESALCALALSAGTVVYALAWHFHERLSRHWNSTMLSVTMTVIIVYAVASCAK